MKKFVISVLAPEGQAGSLFKIVDVADAADEGLLQSLIHELAQSMYGPNVTAYEGTAVEVPSDTNVQTDIIEIKEVLNNIEDTAVTKTSESEPTDPNFTPDYKFVEE